MYAVYPLNFLLILNSSEKDHLFISLFVLFNNCFFLYEIYIFNASEIYFLPFAFCLPTTEFQTNLLAVYYSNFAIN